MTPLERKQLQQLEPELRSSVLRTRLPRRTLSPLLRFALAALRVYVVIAVGLLVATFIHGLHR